MSVLFIKEKSNLVKTLKILFSFNENFFFLHN
jgi:hypothetical protein